MFNKEEEKRKNQADFECQVCKEKFDNPNKDSQNAQSILVRCEKCLKGQCKVCLVKEHQLKQNPNHKDKNDIVLQSIFKALGVEFDHRAGKDPKED